MSTLQLILEQTRYIELWSWESQKTVHQTARVVMNTRLTKRGNVRVAYLGPRGQESQSLVVTKMARDSNEVAILEREYRVYMEKLRHLQGSVVPVCYGLFKGKVEGEDFACMLLEYCRGAVTYSLADRNDQVMLAVCKLHQAGILHGSLDDNHHIVCSNVGIRIVDFSDVVENHRCVGAMPLLMHPNGKFIVGGNGCPELGLMEKIYGIMDCRHRVHC